MWKSSTRRGGTSRASCSWAFSALVRSPISPSRRLTRCTCVSTGSTGLRQANKSTQATVFGPTPGNRLRYSMASGVGVEQRKSSDNRPRSSWIACKMALIRGAFVFARPPERIAFKGESSGNTEIYVADYDGANPAPVTRDRALVAAPCWVPARPKSRELPYDESWYSARNPRGSWRQAEPRRVPSELTRMPPGLFRQWQGRPANLPERLPPPVTIRPGVRVVPDLDEEVFYVKGYYWARRDGHWFRARNHRGSWIYVEPRRAPRELVQFAPGQYRHWRGHEGDQHRRGGEMEHGRHDEDRGRR